jgi:hypothetical protein
VEIEEKYMYFWKTPGILRPRYEACDRMVWSWSGCRYITLPVIVCSQFRRNILTISGPMFAWSSFAKMCEMTQIYDDISVIIHITQAFLILNVMFWLNEPRVYFVSLLLWTTCEKWFVHLRTPLLLNLRIFALEDVIYLAY